MEGISNSEMDTSVPTPTPLLTTTPTQALHGCKVNRLQQQQRYSKQQQQDRYWLLGVRQ